MPRVVSLALAVLVAALAWTVLATPASASSGDDGEGDRSEAEATASCSGPTRLRLRLREREGSIRIELDLRNARGGSSWRVILLHERRIAYDGSLRATGGSLSLRRTVPDWFGPDTVAVRAAGPRSTVCRVSATVG